ncbi:MAG: catalase [Pseudomonadota bacterium]
MNIRKKLVTQATDLIDALNGTFGRHAGFRASHAKGFAVTGNFLPDTASNGVEIPLLSLPVDVKARFSVGGGKPGISDKSPTVRGIGLEFASPTEKWSMALISAPVFFANSAEQFREFLAARVPDPEIGGPNPDKVQAFNAANPNTVPHQLHLKNTPPCLSYTTEFYHSGHAYGFTVGGERVDARIMLEPEQGRVGLTEDQMAAFPDNYLQDRLREELLDGPARWTLKLVVANADDNLGDPTEPWTGDNSSIPLGTLEITAEDPTDAGQERVFDPSNMPEGVHAPKDDVFNLRSPAYAVSVGRRAS